MFARIAAVMMNTHREAVRARVLFGLLGAALAASIYSLFVAALSASASAPRIVADIGSASTSLFAILVSIVLGATSLYRELELKTVFPILTRRLRRHEYILGKYLGVLATVVAFVAIDGAVVLTIVAVETKEHVGRTIGGALAVLVVLGVLLVVARRARVFVVLPWSIFAFVVAAVLARHAGGEQQLVIWSLLLTIAETGIVTAIAMLFSSFSSPFLTALFTSGVFFMGRSAGTLASLPETVLGNTVKSGGKIVSYVIPNLHTFVPARPLLLGQLADQPIVWYVLRAWGISAAYAFILLFLSAFIFRTRDFQ